MKLPSSAGIDTEIILRCLAIAAVVFNHSHMTVAGPGEFGFGGGMAFLMLLSGYNLARFGLHNSSASDFKKSCLNLAARIALPTLAIIILSIPINKGAEPLYFLFISNWWSAKHPAILHIWYPEVIVQLMLFFWLFFSVKPVANLFLKYPLLSTVILFIVAVILRWAMPYIWNPPELKGRLPQIHLWNFVLGMLIFFVLHRDKAHNLLSIGLILTLTLAGTLVAYSPYKMDFWWLIIATMLWLIFPRVKIWTGLARAFQVVGQSAFTIFLLHAGFLFIYRHIFVHQQLLGPIQLPPWPVLQFIFAFTGSIAAWIVLTSFTRAYRVIKGGN